MKIFIKKALPHIGVLFFFLLLTVVYFTSVFEGKVLPQHDVSQFSGMAQEVLEYGEKTGWTGSMFSGMPTYQITGYGEGTNFVDKLKIGMMSLMDPNTAGPIFIFLIMSYILCLFLTSNIYIAVLGAIALALSSYNLIIIEAGHVNKAWALAFTPLILAGFIGVFRKKYWLGFLLFTMGLALQISANHLQITYYTALFCFILIIPFLISCIKKKEFRHLALSVGIFSLGILFTVGANINNLYLTYELSKESIRGQSELTPQHGTETEKVSTGLDKDYAFSWSYGKAETFTLLIPNLMGGESGGYLGKDSHLYKALQAQGAQLGKNVQTYTYWGDQPFTSGPVYFGAIICFLFILSFFILSGKAKWWMLGACIFFFFLSWGKYFESFNDFMFYHFPYYNKFRTVSMALVIPGIIFPVLAVMALNEILKGKIDSIRMKNALVYATGITGGICLVLWIMPGVFFNFQSPMDAAMEIPAWYYDALLQDRKALLQSDAFRSLAFILLAAGLVFWYINAKNKQKTGIYVSVAILLLVLCDLWQIDKRYLNKDKFVTKREYTDQTFKKSLADEEILKDDALSYRVLNMNNPFNETKTSYYHKSIGGYQAAKLRRYQDLIERRISLEMESINQTFKTNPTLAGIDSTLSHCPTLNMLNTKYIIYNPEQPPIPNFHHDGNAWFVDSYRFANTADEEMTALNNLDPKKEAILDKKFAENLDGLQIIPDSMAKIDLTKYTPDRLEYKSVSEKGGLAVFSEIYYPYGWKAYIDGKQVPISRADWTLRAIPVPAGEHQIVMEFDHDGVKICGIVTTTSSGLLMLILIAFILFYFYQTSRNRKNKLE